MPCWTTSQTQVELGQNTNADHLLSALKALNLNPLRSNGIIRFNGGTYAERTGALTLYLEGALADKLTADIKRGYITQGAMATVAKFGFSLKMTGPNKFSALKRTL